MNSGPDLLCSGDDLRRGGSDGGVAASPDMAQATSYHTTLHYATLSRHSIHSLTCCVAAMACDAAAAMAALLPAPMWPRL